MSETTTSMDSGVHTVLGFDAFRAIYGTLMVMTSLALVEPSPNDPVLELIAVIFVPLIALTAAHGFAESAQEQIRLGRRLTWAERRRLGAENARFLLVGVAPLLLLLVAAAVDSQAQDVVSWLLGLGVVTLFGWGWIVGRRINMGRLRTLVYAIGFAVLGLLILGLETALH